MTAATLEFLPPVTMREPPGIVSTALGDETIEYVETCGIFLDPWQKWCVRMAMAERKVGSWAAFECGVVTPRQNGKNYYLRALQLGYLFLLDDDLLLHSAHQWDTVNVHRKWFMDLLESHDELGSLLKPVDRRTGRSKSFVNINGDEQVVLTTGQSIVFKTRSGGKGRGFTGDKVFFDEAQKLDASSMGDTIPVLSTRPGAQVHYTGSAPNGRSAVLHSVITRGRKPDPDDRLFLAEWGNTVDVLELAADSPEFMDRIRAANPAVVAGRITEEYVRQEIRTFSGTPELVEEHRRERLGVAENPSQLNVGPISLDQWDALEDKASEAVGRVTVALDVSPDRHHASISAAGRRDDNVFHVETVAHRPGTSWVVAAMPGILTDAGSDKVRIEKGGPAGSLIAQLEEAGIVVEQVTTADHARATGLMIDSCLSGGLRHLGQQSLRSAIVGAQLRASGDAELWSRRSSKVDITPLVAATLALGGVPALADTRQPLYFDAT